MAKFYIFLLCLFAAKAICDVQEDRAAHYVGLFATNIGFLDDFFSLDNIEELKHSSQNIPPATINNIEDAASIYRSLRGPILEWCTFVNNTMIDLTKPNIGEITSLKDYDRTFDSSLFSNITLNAPAIWGEIKQKLDSVITNQIDSDKPSQMFRSQSTAPQSNNLRPYRATYNNNYVLLQAQAELEYTETMRKVKNAINDLKKAIDVPITIDRVDVRRMNSLCEPVFNILNGLSSPRRQQDEKPSPIIKPSNEDVIQFYREGCSGSGYFSPKATSCQAFFTELTMKFFLANYFYEETVAEMLGAINPSSLLRNCNRHLTSFIKNNYLSWENYARRMRDTQFLSMYVCSINEESNKVEILRN